VRQALERIRIFTAANHVGNEYELLKMAKKYPIKFSYLENNVRRWSKFSARPEPTTWLNKDEFEWVTYFDPSQYDLAIIRIDQQHADPNLGKSQLSRQLLETVGKSIPTIIVNHGTPMWDEFYTEEVVKYGGKIHTNKGIKQIGGIKDLVKDAAVMIVNSYESVNRWQGVHDNIFPTIHGMDASEWWDLPKEPRVVLPLSPGGLDKYYNRSLCTAIKGAVKEKTGLDVIHFNVNISFDQDNWSQYREYLGRSLISIFPFKDSPMPRSRTEAFLSGSCVLSSKYHNADEFIKNGVNGLIVPDNPLSYAEAIDILINEGYRDAVAIGQEGKKMAKQYFRLDDYLDEMYDIFYEVSRGRKPKWDGKKRWGNE
jgi:hypothetical protein